MSDAVRVSKLEHRWRRRRRDVGQPQHYADVNYGDFQRIMHRVTLRGDIPIGPQPA